MPRPSNTTEIAERFSPPLPQGDIALDPPAPASISGDRQRLRNLQKCASLAEWIEIGEAKHPNPGGISSARISLHMLRSSNLPVGYGFEFDRHLRRVSLRHHLGVVIHGQPLLVSCDDAFDAELRYHYCSFETFSRLIESQELDASIWRHRCTSKLEPSAFPNGPEEIPHVLGSSQEHSLGYCIPLRQAPPLGTDLSHSEPQSESEAGAQLATSDEDPNAEGYVAIPLKYPEQQEEFTPFFDTETSADERSDGGRSRRRRSEQKELLEMLHRQRKATSKETPSKELPAVAKGFLLSTMLEWRQIMATPEMQDIGWAIPSRHLMRIWTKLPSRGQWLKFSFQSHASGVAATLQRNERRWTLTSKDETVRSEASEDAAECWFEFRRFNASTEIRVGHGLSTDSPPVARVATKVLGEMKVGVVAEQPVELELGHDAFLDPNVNCAQDISKLACAVDLKDVSGTSVLTHAVRQGDLRVVIALLAAKANVHARDAKLCTALHYSAHDGNAEAAKVLLQASASAFARNCSGS